MESFENIANQQSSFSIDYAKLEQLGFCAVEIQCMENVLNAFGKITMQSLQAGAGLNYEQAQRIVYMYNICAGRVRVSTEEELTRHLKKMFGRAKKITIDDLPVSTIHTIPRTAMIAGIHEDGYSIWNSKNYPEMERAYKVVGVSGGYIHLETNRWPVLKYKQAKKIPGVLEIKSIDKEHHTLIVAIHKDYCKICNRFAIVASTRRPEFHLGLVKIICIEGTRIYVYATDIGIKENIHYSSGNSRVYSYGYYIKDIKPRLMSTASQVYKYVYGFSAQTIPGNRPFEYLTITQDPDAPDDSTPIDAMDESSANEPLSTTGPSSSTSSPEGDFSW